RHRATRGAPRHRSAPTGARDCGVVTFGTSALPSPPRDPFRVSIPPVSQSAGNDVVRGACRRSQRHGAARLSPVPTQNDPGPAPLRPVATPGIVGTAQSIDRPGDHDLLDAPGPIELMVAAARAAADDAGAPTLLDRVGWIGVTGGFYRYRNPAAVVAEELGLSGVGTAITEITGTAPQDMVGLACERIAAGELDAALVLGGEARWTNQQLKRQ